MIATETAAKSVKERLMAMASKGQIKLSADWKPTALISVISNRKDLSDLDKIRLAARAKMEGNLNEMLPKKFGQSKYLSGSSDTINDRDLKFQADEKNTEAENVDPTKKWSTVVFSELASPAACFKTPTLRDNPLSGHCTDCSGPSTLIVHQY